MKKAVSLIFMLGIVVALMLMGVMEDKLDAVGGTSAKIIFYVIIAIILLILYLRARKQAAEAEAEARERGEYPDDINQEEEFIEQSEADYCDQAPEEFEDDIPDEDSK